MALRLKNIFELVINAKDSATNKVNKVGNSFSNLKKKVEAASKAIISASAAFATGKFFAGGIRSAASFEEQLSKVSAVTRATAEEMKLLEEAANNAGTVTKFTATEAAQGLEVLARSGASVNDSISLLPNVLSLATAESLELAEAATFITATLAQYRLGIENAAKITDLLVAGSQEADTNVRELGGALSFVGGVANNANISIEDTVALLDLLAKNAIRGERAGTGLRSILLDLANPASAARRELAALGDTSGDLFSAIRTIEQAGERGSAALLSFGKVASPAISALVASGTKDLNNLRDTFQDVEDRAAEAASVMSDNFAGAITKLSSATDALQRKVAKPFLGPLTLAVEDLAGLVAFLAKGGNNTAQAFDAIAFRAALAKRGIEDLQEGADPAKFLELATAQDDLQGSFEKTEKKIDSYRRQLSALIAGAEEGGGLFKALALSLRDQEKIYEKQAKQLSDIGVKLTSLVNPELAKQQERANSVSSAMEKLTDKQKQFIDELTRSRDAGTISQQLFDQLKASALGLSQTQGQLAQVNGALVDSTKALGEEQAQLKTLYDEGKITLDTYKSALASISSENEKVKVSSEGLVDKIKEQASALAEANASRRAARQAISDQAAAERDAENAARENANAIDKTTESVDRQVSSINLQTVALNLMSQASRDAFFGNTQDANGFSEELNRVNTFLVTMEENLRGLQQFTSVNLRDASNSFNILLRDVAAYRDQLESVERFTARFNEKIEQGTVTTQDLARAAEFAARDFEKLDRSQLNGLNESIGRAEQALKRVTLEAQRARAELDSIEDALLSQIETREQAEQRRFEQERARIAELARFDQQRAKELEALSDRVHKRNLENIRREQKERSSAQTSLEPSGGARQRQSAQRQQTNQIAPPGAPGSVASGLNGANAGAIVNNIVAVAFDERSKQALFRDFQQRFSRIRS